MDTFLLLVILTQGIVLGVVGLDMFARWKDRKERVALKVELEKSLEGLSTLHNKNAETVRSLQDKVNAHAMALAGRVK